MSQSTRPRILIVIGTLAHVGGAERQGVYLAEYLKSLPNCDVDLLAFADGQPIRDAVKHLDINVHVHPYYFRWPKQKRAISLTKLAARLRFKIRPTVILPFVGIHSKAIAQVAKYSGATFTWWNQQDEGRDLHGTAEERRILNRLSCITSNSTIGRDFLVDTYGLTPDSVLIYNNGTPVPKCQERNDDLRRDLGVDNRQVVTMVANITPFKDHATLLKAFAEVRLTCCTDPVLLLAGHLKDQAHVHGLKNLAFDLGLTNDCVRFLGPVDSINDLLRATDVVAHSSVLEGCPNAVCEAMAFGLPVVATDIPGCRQALGDNARQWLAEPSDSSDLARKLIKLLNNESKQFEVGMANRERILSEFSIEGMNQFFKEQIELGIGYPLS